MPQRSFFHGQLPETRHLAAWFTRPTSGQQYINECIGTNLYRGKQSRYSWAVPRAEKERCGAQRRDRELAELRLRLLNQLDQRVGREKAVLRRTVAVLSARLRRR